MYPKNLEETLYIFGDSGTVKVGGKLDCTGFAGHVEKTYNEVYGRVRNYVREQISQIV